MPTFQYEAMDTTGGQVKDTIDATSEEECSRRFGRPGLLRDPLDGSAKGQEEGQEERRAAGERKKTKVLTLGGVNMKHLVMFTRQFSVLQDAGLPVLRSLKILEGQMKPGVLKNSLIDVVDDIESGNTLSEAFGKHPKCFDRLFRQHGQGRRGRRCARPTSSRRLAEFMEKGASLARSRQGGDDLPLVGDRAWPSPS